MFALMLLEPLHRDLLALERLLQPILALVPRDALLRDLLRLDRINNIARVRNLIIFPADDLHREAGRHALNICAPLVEHGANFRVTMLAGDYYVAFLQRATLD